MFVFFISMTYQRYYLLNDIQEQLNYSIGGNSIDSVWEKARLAIPISSK